MPETGMVSSFAADKKVYLCIAVINIGDEMFLKTLLLLIWYSQLARSAVIVMAHESK